jgi:hypothetical protein
VKSDWWRWPGTTSLIAREYTKYLLTWLRQRMGLSPEIGAPALTAPAARPEIAGSSAPRP